MDPFFDWIPDYERRGQVSRMTEGEKARMTEGRKEGGIRCRPLFYCQEGKAPLNGATTEEGEGKEHRPWIPD